MSVSFAITLWNGCVKADIAHLLLPEKIILVFLRVSAREYFLLFIVKETCVSSDQYQACWIKKLIKVKAARV